MCRYNLSRDLFMRVTWLTHMCDMTYSYARHDSFIYVYLSMVVAAAGSRHMTHSCVRHDPLTCTTWLIHMCDTTHLYAKPDSFIRVYQSMAVAAAGSCHEQVQCLKKVIVLLKCVAVWLFGEFIFSLRIWTCRKQEELLNKNSNSPKKLLHVFFWELLFFLRIFHLNFPHTNIIV